MIKLSFTEEEDESDKKRYMCVVGRNFHKNFVVFFSSIVEKIGVLYLHGISRTLCI